MNDRDHLRVSVIIPAYNMDAYIGAAIDSVLDSALEGVEVIVVDDGSTDSTPCVVRPYTDTGSPTYDPRVVYMRQDNAGKSRAVNRGFERAQGEYFTVVDADDELTPQSISTRYAAGRSEGGTRSDLVIGAFEAFDQNTTYGVRRPPTSCTPKHLHDRFYLSWKTPFHMNACLFSHDLVRRAGGLDETLDRCIDGDYALRLLKEANEVTTVQDVVYRYRKHRTSISDRLKFRLKTAQYRPRVVWKNYDGWRQCASVPFALLMDAGKLLYEVVNSYRT